MRVAMIGTGYVGLVSGACFADFGHVVTCVDKDASKIERRERGEIPIFEPGLDELVAVFVCDGRLFFALDGAEAIRDADAVFIAGGTPSRRGDGHADLSYVYAAAEEIAGLIDGFTVIVTKSTVPVGTGDEIEKIIKAKRPDAQFAVVSNPGILGLTFKPNTDDMRDAPSLDVVPALQAMGATVQAFDPEGRHEAEKMLPGVEYKDGPYDAAESADCLVILTEWDQFRALDLDRIKVLMKAPVLVDLRNVYRPDDMRSRGCKYTSIGRP